MSFLLTGKFLEVLAKRKTSQALVFLLKAQPHQALLVEPGGDDSGHSPVAASEESLRKAEGGARANRSARDGGDGVQGDFGAEHWGWWW